MPRSPASSAIRVARCGRSQLPEQLQDAMSGDESGSAGDEHASWSRGRVSLQVEVHVREERPSDRTHQVDLEQGSGVTCATREAPLGFNPPGRQHCMDKPPRG